MSFHKLEGTKEYPWEKWTVFLHPAQRELVERRFGGPCYVSRPGKEFHRSPLI